MRKHIMILTLGTIIVTNGMGQVLGTPVTSGTVPTLPVGGLSELEVQSRLFTQNSVGGAAGTQRRGSFTTDARWNSMGNLSTSSQTLNGFRTQTDGRALVWGHRVPNGDTVSNSFIQWGGNNAASVSPGSLEFRSFTDPTGAMAMHRFSIRENGTSFFGLTPPAISIDNPWLEIIYNDIKSGSSATSIKSKARFGLDENVGVYGLALGNSTH